MNKFEKKQQVIDVADELGITHQLAKELLILAGGDADLVIKSSNNSVNVAECKAAIIDGRFKKEE